MWYKIDIKRFGWLMLPPILRGETLGAILMVLLVPLVEVYNRFLQLRTRQRQRLEGNGQVISMRHALIKRFRLQKDDIEVVDAQEHELYLYRQDETGAPLYLSSEAGAMLKHSGEGRSQADYFIFVPDFLQEQDQELKTLLDHYRPAGRKYELKYYTYG